MNLKIKIGEGSCDEGPKVFEEDTLRKALTLLEESYALDVDLGVDELAEKMGIPEDNEAFENFCTSYDNLRDERMRGVRLFEENKFNFYRTLRNGVFGALLGSLAPHTYEGAAAMAGTSMVITAADEGLNKGNMDLRSGWVFTLVGGLLGNWLMDDKVLGAYLWGGIGGALGVTYELHRSVQRKAKFKSKRAVQTDFKKKVDLLVKQYAIGEQ